MAPFEAGGTWHASSFPRVGTYPLQTPRGWRIVLDPRFTPATNSSLIPVKIRGRWRRDSSAERKESQ